jgi:hypothetical protein
VRAFAMFGPQLLGGVREGGEDGDGRARRGPAAIRTSGTGKRVERNLAA